MRRWLLIGSGLVLGGVAAWWGWRWLQYRNAPMSGTTGVADIWVYPSE
jgi:hypothetical protein